MDKKHLGILLEGLAVGDSLGSTSEFTSREEVLELYEKHKGEGWPFRHVGGGYFNWKPGQITDDAYFAALMVKSFLEKGKFDPEDVAERFIKWVEGDPIDVGTTTLHSIKNIAAGIPWYEGGLRDFERRPLNASNGSILRNGVIPAMAETLDDAYRFSLYHCIMTHYAPHPVLCCAAQTFIIWEFLQGRNPLKWTMMEKKTWDRKFRDSWNAWLKKSAGDSADADPVVAGWLGKTESMLAKAWKDFQGTDFNPDLFSPYVYSPRGGAGYVLTTTQIAIWATEWSLRTEPYPTPEGYPKEIFAKQGPWTLGWIAVTGGDTDSYGATAGSMIAAAHGGLPGELTEGLLIREEFPELCG